MAFRGGIGLHAHSHADGAAITNQTADQHHAQNHGDAAHTVTYAKLTANTFTGVQTFPAGSSGAVSIAFQPTTGIYFKAGAQIVQVIGGSERWTTSGTGHVSGQTIFPSIDDNWAFGDPTLRWGDGFFTGMFVDGTTSAKSGVLLGNGSTTTSTLWAGSGAPAAGLGTNGDYYLRQDAGVGTHLYFKAGGAWAAVI